VDREVDVTALGGGSKCGLAIQEFTALQKRAEKEAFLLHFGAKEGQNTCERAIFLRVLCLKPWVLYLFACGNLSLAHL
jgi:hypothetical protein